MVELFADESLKQMDQIQHAWAERDYAALNPVVHTLKGSVSIFAAQNVFDSARRIETMANDCELGEFEVAGSD